MSAAGPNRIDGRTARAGRTRAAIVEAHVALILDGDLRPTAERIAERAGVSLRALWGHFADMETLFAASAETILQRQDAAYRPVDPALPLHQRIERYCAQRARLLEQLAPAARAGQLKEPFSPVLRGYRVKYVDRARAELTDLFAPELAAAGAARDTVLTALIAVSLWPTWSTLRDDLGLDVDAARTTLAHTITALLPPPDLSGEHDRAGALATRHPRESRRHVGQPDPVGDQVVEA